MATRYLENPYLEEPRRSLSGWFVWIIFRAPGKAVLWWEYMYPRRGYVYASGRRYGNPIVEVITSIGFWFAAAYITLLFSHPGSNAPPPRVAAPYGHSLYPQQIEPNGALQPAPVASAQASDPVNPSPPATNEVAQARIVIVTDFANLRAAPSRTAAVVDLVNADEELMLINRRGSWAEVRRAATGSQGWIHRSLISPAR